MDGTTGAVGFIGLGNIGAPMAGHLVDWPGGLVVCDVRPEAVEPFVAKGARAAATPAEVAAAADVISVMVRDDAQAEEVLDGILTAGRSGLVVAVHSTIAPGTAERLAATAAPAGVAVVDAAVSGGPMGAAEGKLAVLAGGDAEAVDRCREPFGRWAGRVERFGPVGAGTRAKLARNLVTYVSYAAVGEGLRLAEASGVDVHKLGEVIRYSDSLTGGPGSIAVRRTTAPMTDDDPLRPPFVHGYELGEKDLRLALDLAGELDVDLPLAGLALAHLAATFGLSS
jgi:3-hydroxyisobutyrate dehydrogenase-like beta-hydroxyacid dehydrogenase